jgi:hypothetical protein
MTRTIPAIALALVLSGGTTPLRAQGVTISLGGGATAPLSDYKDYAKTGWMTSAGVHVLLPKAPVEIAAEGLFGQNTHNDGSGDKTVLYGAVANIAYAFDIPNSPVKPYVVGSVGGLNHHYSPGTSGYPSENQWKAVFGGGAGVRVAFSGFGIFVEGRYLKRDTTVFLPILAGVRIGG